MLSIGIYNCRYSEEGPHFTVLPDGVLQVFSTQLSHCSESIIQKYDEDSLQLSTEIIQCLIIISRSDLLILFDFTNNLGTIIVMLMSHLPPHFLLMFNFEFVSWVLYNIHVGSWTLLMVRRQASNKT